MIERRVHPRYPVKLDVRCTSELRTVQVQSKDLSVGGVFLYTTRPDPMGTRVSLLMQLPDGSQVEVAGHVVHSIAGVGMGVEFQRFSERSAPALEGFLATLQRTPRPVSEERRAHIRQELRTEVHLESASNFYTGFTQDVSAGGVFVATEEALLPIGDEVALQFSLPDGGPPIAVRAEVRWQRVQGAGPDAPAGLGLRFVTLPPADQQRIEAFATRRDTMFYDDE